MRMPHRQSAAAAALAVVVPLPLHLAGEDRAAKHHHRKPSAQHAKSPSHAKRARPGAPRSIAAATSGRRSAAKASGTKPAAPAQGSAVTRTSRSASASARHELRSGAGPAAARRVRAGEFGGGVPGPGSSHTPLAFTKHAQRESRAHAAGDPTDVITDFKFAPATITVHAGDTVTWVNNGPTEHSATASDKSFDTGLLQKGASASHTFTQAGTFAYICKIHPFMHGTVIVLAGTTTAPSGSGSPSSSAPATSASAGSSAPGTPASPASATSSANDLPSTGFDAAASLLSGLGLLGIGYLVRRRTRRAQ
jgi:LPXTG-motif cell wall-anchored protein